MGGSEKRSLWIWENDRRRMIRKTMTFVPDLYRVFNDMLVNAADRSRNPNMTNVNVGIDVATNLISFRIKGEQDIHVPDFIFDTNITSKNYEENWSRANLVTSLLSEFTIETAAGARERLKYKQVFTNNTQQNKSEIEKKVCHHKVNWTKVSFKPDLKELGMECLDDDTIGLLKRRVVDLAGCLGNGVKVELDGKRVPPKTFEGLANLYLPTSLRIFEKINNQWEVCVCLADEVFQQVSFVNNIATLQGGSHVDHILDQIKSSHLVRKACSDIMKCVWVFVNATTDNATFESETKERLTTEKGSFGSTCELSPDFLNRIANLLSAADLNLKKDGNFEGAKMAGTDKSGDCSLILTEGDSAKKFAISILSRLSQEAQGYYAVYALQGKLLNVREASPQQASNNVEIRSIKKILGLQHNKVYENTTELQYGNVIIMADQDHDGSHLKGLFINYVHWGWPSLLKISKDFVRVLITPIYIAINEVAKKKTLFYTIPKYEEWETKVGDQEAQKYEITYYKGLGSFSEEEIKEYFADLESHIMDFYWEDHEDDDAIELAFSKKKIEERKHWLRANKDCIISLDYTKKRVRYRDFINLELRQYSWADLHRSIPSLPDGLKPSQRKILYIAFKYPHEKIKVDRLAGRVVDQAAYHHRFKCLTDAIIGMAQNYVGSNNINLLQPLGNFGAREMGGTDCGEAGYISTKLSPITRNIFHEADELLVESLKHAGQSIEPRCYIPIIPMVLVNGCEGIGTGWSTFIPNYDPQDIIRNLNRLLNGETMVPMRPYYKGFNGNIEKTIPEKNTRYTTTGVYSVTENDTIHITELPVGAWTKSYKEFLERASQDDGNDKQSFIKSYTTCYDNKTVEFTISMTQEQMKTAKQEGILKKFKLTTTLATTNMHLFDANGVIKKYDTPEQILQEFFDFRIKFYQKRRTAQLSKLEETLSQLETQYGDASNSNKKKIQQEIKKKKKERDLLTKTSAEDLWRKDLTALDQRLKELEDGIDDVTNWTVTYGG